MAGVEIQSLRLIEQEPLRHQNDCEKEKEKIFIDLESSIRRHSRARIPSHPSPLSNYIQASSRENIRQSLATDSLEDNFECILPPHRRRNVGKSLTAYGKPLRLRGLSVRRSHQEEQETPSEENRNLSICFLNETASEDEEEKDEEVYSSLKIERVSAKSLVKGNISTKKGHVIIPINDTKKKEFLKSSSSSSDSSSPLPSPSKSTSSFPEQIKAIQDEAKRKLEEAKYVAAKTIENDRTQRRLNSPTCRILGLQYSKKLNRTILTDMNVAQLQVILNSFLSTIEGLNEDLVQYLILRDELAIEQDSLLTDIEDITQSLRLDN